MKSTPFYWKLTKSILLLIALLCLNLGVFAQDTLVISICPGDEVTLTATANDGYCSPPEPVFWSTDGIVISEDLSPGNDKISDLTVSPLSTTVYTAFSPSTTCPGQSSNWGMCGVGSYGGGPQGPAGPAPSPVYYSSNTTIIQVEVVPCAGSIVSAEGCLLPFTGEMFFDYCQGDLFYFLETSDGNIFDPYFVDGLSFVPYDGQIVHFAYEFADFDAGCGEGIETVWITCIEESPESIPVGDDAGITRILAPTEIEQDGIQTVSARLINLGSTVLTNTTINWKVNGVDQQAYNYVGNLYPSVPVDLNLGNYAFEANKNYIIEARTNDPNGLVDTRPNNDSSGKSYIGDPNSSTDNILYMCRGENFSLQAPSVSLSTACYEGCTPGTSDCLTCGTEIAPQQFTNCESGCSSFTVTPEHSIHYQVTNECVNATTGVCTTEVTDYFVIVNSCGEDQAVGNCNYQKTGTIFFEICDGVEYYYIEQSDGTIVDPYYAFGVAFDHYEGQVVSYDSSPATFDSPCGGNDAVTVTCIEEVDMSVGVDFGVKRIVQPFYATEGNGVVILQVNNYGTDPIYHSMLNWTLNGETQSPYQYIAPDGEPLMPGDSTMVVVDSYDFEAIDYEITAFTSAPNGIPDPNPANDMANSSLEVGYVPLDTLHWGSYQITASDADKGFNMSLNLPSQGNVCSIPSVPTVSPNLDWESDGNTFTFYPDEDRFYTITYEGTCETYVFTIEFEANERQIEIDALLYGAYNPETGLMDTYLSENEVIVPSQPFAGAPWYYDGAESYAYNLNNVVDWVLVEARTGTPNLTSAVTDIVETQAAILLLDGSVVDPSTGYAPIFENLTPGESYHIVLRHRNHLDVISANPVVLEGTPSYDFTTSLEQAFGPEQLKITEDGRYALYSGDFNGDGLVQTSDYDIWFAEPAAVNVYAPADANLDGVVQSTDYDEWFNNKAKVGVIEIRLE